MAHEKKTQTIANFLLSETTLLPLVSDLSCISDYPCCCVQNYFVFRFSLFAPGSTLFCLFDWLSCFCFCTVWVILSMSLLAIVESNGSLIPGYGFEPDTGWKQLCLKCKYRVKWLDFHEYCSWSTELALREILEAPSRALNCIPGII